MKPENHAIRQLEKQLEGATPEVREQIERVIASLNTVLLNRGNPEAMMIAQRHLAEEVGRLEWLKKS